MDPFRLCVALAPIAFYFLVLGVANLGRRPRMVTGTRDLAALAVGVTGLLVVGPMELFLPEVAAYRFGGYIWLFMLAFYGLCVSLAILLSRPRLVIYNMTIDGLRPILAELVPRLDGQARWAGDGLALPGLGVELHLESFVAMRNVSLVAVGEQQNFDGWRQLEYALREPLKATRVQRNPRGATLIAAAIMLIVACLVQTFGDPQALAQGMRELLRL